ncbi:MAG: AAA family ATPase [Pyrinomonadaceae bacterium]|nr:AAA family ATPase [Pyrinomonadaceae bacterium]
MIKEIRYKNFKALRDATLPLGRFTLIVGANGTGKTTAMQVLKLVGEIDADNISKFLSKGLDIETNSIEIEIVWDNFSLRRTVSFETDVINHGLDENRNVVGGSNGSYINSLKSFFKHEKESEELRSFQNFSFDPEEIARTVRINNKKELDSNGGNLAGILDFLKDTEPELWKELNDELGRWLPEFDQILFDRSDDGKSIVLRTRFGKHKIKASDLSHGTRLALAFLAVSYLPNPPKIVAFEEPERGIHPRLLENIQEAMYRLAYPENYGEKREPIQVIATTHSPYLLDLYKDFREEIVIASKDENGVHFERLSEMPNIDEIIQDAPLGEVWFTGVLGGVPAQL